MIEEGVISLLFYLTKSGGCHLYQIELSAVKSY